MVTILKVHWYMTNIKQKLLFFVVAINDREINPSISFKLQGPESITCRSDFIISVWIDWTDLFPTISSCSMPER